jgi:ribosomal protein S18 acetylase RimI-like enzyme
MTNNASVHADEGDVEEGRESGESNNRDDHHRLTSQSHGGFIRFRSFHEGDRDQVQELHNEWFPVSYKDEFYDELVHERMVNTGEKLFTCAAVYHQDDCAESEQDEDYIIACIVGSLLDVARLDKDTASLLVSDPFQYKRVFYIMTLGTVTEFRHARLATTLVEKCIRVVENDDQCGALYLHVITFNTAAITFYERLGFYRVKEIENYYRIDGKLYSCYLYARYFNGNRGHWDVYYVMRKMLSSVWQTFTKPLAMITYSGHDR